jgi:hypothetical protein
MNFYIDKEFSDAVARLLCQDNHNGCVKKGLSIPVMENGSSEDELNLLQDNYDGVTLFGFRFDKLHTEYFRIVLSVMLLILHYRLPLSL